MASSASLTTTHLPKLRTELQEWEQKQKPAGGFAVPLSEIADPAARARYTSKDVIVAFRTRPPLENEASAKFKPSKAYATFRKEDGENGAEKRPAALSNEEAEVEFCAGISVTSGEPGVFVAHVPGSKVNSSCV